MLRIKTRRDGKFVRNAVAGWSMSSSLMVFVAGDGKDARARIDKTKSPKPQQMNSVNYREAKSAINHLVHNLDSVQSSPFHVSQSSRMMWIDCVTFLRSKQTVNERWLVVRTKCLQFVIEARLMGRMTTRKRRRLFTAVTQDKEVEIKDANFSPDEIFMTQLLLRRGMVSLVKPVVRRLRDKEK